MKIAVLTNKTTHHAFFVKEITKKFKNVDVFLEKKFFFNKFKIAHSIDNKISNFEKKKCFKKKNFFLSKFNKLQIYSSFNSDKFYNSIKKKKYDLVIVFGSRILKPKIINLFKNHIYNLHGGNPEMYRGLDSLYWTIFNNEFNHIVTTLHLLEKKVDTGKLFLIKKIPLKKNMKFFELRYYNTLNCVDLCKILISKILKKKKISLKKQKKIGHYYSAMPADLKNYCINQFENFTKNI